MRNFINVKSFPFYEESGGIVILSVYIIIVNPTICHIIILAGESKNVKHFLIIIKGGIVMTGILVLVGFAALYGLSVLECYLN